MKTAIIAALLLALVPGVAAHAEDAMSISEAYAIGTPSPFPWSVTGPQPGDPITFYGSISAVGQLFSDLLPAPPYDLTFYVDGTCKATGVWDDFICQNGGTIALFEAATLSVYLEPSGTHAYIVPSSYTNGELVLQAQVYYFDILDNDPVGPCLTNYPDVHVDFQFTGGSWFDRVSENGVGVDGKLEAELTNGTDEPLIGYTLHFVDGALNPLQPVATESTTWGHVKALYR